MTQLIEVSRKNKSYDKRKLVITVDSDKYYVEPWLGWYAISTSNKKIRQMVRPYIMDNLYWLIGKDCDLEEWKCQIEHLDKGRGVDGCYWNNSWFFEGEKEKAFLSFYN